MESFFFLMQRITSYYRYFNLLSLDVALGATISAMFLTRVFEVDIRFQGLLCLGLTVWLIYTMDHLVDARKLKSQASTERHRFHQQNFNMIIVLAIIILLAIIPLLFFIYESVLSMGIGLGALVVVYFIVQRKLGFLKELLGAVLYSVGVMLPVIALSELSFNSLIAIPSVLFFNTALINLVLFSWFDRDKDKLDNHPSLVTSVGDKVSKAILYFLFVLQVVLFFYAFDTGLNVSMLMVYTAMYLVLLLIFIKASWFALNDRYRLAGDAVFLFPLLYIIG
ncbi:MAG: hypothetical protein KDC93_06145 [Cyclobacteriaceae bacterium]|nr:hypothetical protein [Cyclobacteriaceae bacterium]